MRRSGCSFFPFQIGQAAFSFGSDSMLLTHEALPIKLKKSRRNAKSRWSRIPDCQARAQSLKATEPTGSLRPVIMPKILIGASILLLMLSEVFGVLSNGKVKEWRTEAENASKSREIAERARAAQQKNLKGREAGVATTKAKSAEIETRFVTAESDLAKSQTKKPLFNPNWKREKAKSRN